LIFAKVRERRLWSSELLCCIVFYLV
jgi:hypothetical protein